MAWHGKKHTNIAKLRISDSKYKSVKIINTKPGEEKITYGNAKAAKFFNMGLSTFRRYKSKGKIINNKYFAKDI